MTMRITESLIDSSRKPGSGTVRVFDFELPGFGELGLHDRLARIVAAGFA